MQLPKVNEQELVINNNIEVLDSYTINDYSIKYGTLEFFEGVLDNDKEFDKTIKYIEKLVRTSLEYRNYIKYLKSELKIDSCAILKNINTEIASIEFHHSPFTLYDITEIILNYFINTNKEFSCIDVAELITRLHYENKIGLVPLTKTIHELVHNGEIFININHIYGDIECFIYEYNIGLNSSHIEKLKRVVELSDDIRVEDINKNILREKRIGLSYDNINNFVMLEKKEGTTI